MGQTPPSPLLGRIAVHLGMIDMDQLAEATRQQGRQGGKPNLAEILVLKGFITQDQLTELLEARKQVIAKHRAREAVAQADEGRPEIASADSRSPITQTPGSQMPGSRTATPPDPGTPGAEASVAATPTTSPMRGAASPSPSPTSATSEDGGALGEVLRLGVERGASDIHVHSGVPLRLRVHGRFVVAGEAPISRDAAESMLMSALEPEQRAALQESGELDFAYTLPGVGRFRVNFYRQQNGLDGVFRYIPASPASLDELGLPTSLAKFTNFHQGLVLITGPANCGKSATMAALVDIINEERRDHILTIEDPIETLHPSKRCVVNQRNVGRHTESFARALRGALREDPDVIVIGELRDYETISLALTAAETGHLVLGTLHTNSTIRTINRLVGVFPADQQGQIRNMVSESLRAVVSQRLVPNADSTRRIPALEVLLINKAVGNLIRENKTFQIQSILQMGASQGMCLMDDALNRLVKDGSITKEEALLHCEESKRITG